MKEIIKELTRRNSNVLMKKYLEITGLGIVLLNDGRKRKYEHA